MSSLVIIIFVVINGIVIVVVIVIVIIMHHDQGTVHAAYASTLDKNAECQACSTCSICFNDKSECRRVGLAETVIFLVLPRSKGCN